MWCLSYLEVLLFSACRSASVSPSRPPVLAQERWDEACRPGTGRLRLGRISGGPGQATPRHARGPVRPRRWAGRRATGDGKQKIAAMSFDGRSSGRSLCLCFCASSVLAVFSSFHPVCGRPTYTDHFHLNKKRLAFLRGYSRYVCGRGLDAMLRANERDCECWGLTAIFLNFFFLSPMPLSMLLNIGLSPFFSFFSLFFFPPCAWCVCVCVSPPGLKEARLAISFGRRFGNLLFPLQ